MAREIETEAQGPVWALATVPAGDRELLVRGGADGMVRLIDAGSGETVRSLSGHAGPVRSLAVIPAGGSGGFGVLASGGVDGTVRIWSLGDYELQHEVRFLDGEVWALVPLRLGDRICLAGTGSGSLIQLWDPASGRQLRTLGETGGRIWALAQVAVDHGELLVSGAADGTIRFWDPRTGQAVQTIKAHESTVWALAAVPGPDGELLASGGADGVVRLWRPGSARTVRAFAGHASTVRALAVVPTGDGEVLASGSADSTVRLWRLDGSDSAPAHTFSGHFGEVWALAPVRVAGRMLLASGGVDGTIQLVDPTTYRTESLLLAGASTVWALSSVALPDRTLLASGGVDGTMLLTNLDTRIVERSLRGHTSTIRALATVPAVGGSGPADSPLVASGGADGTIRVWPVDSDDPRRVLTGHRGEVWALAATVVDGGRRLVSGGADGTVRLWPVDSDGAGVVLGRHEGEVGALATLPGRDGGQHIVASGGTDGKVILWETAAPATGDRRRLAQLDQTGLGGVTALAAVPLPTGVRLVCALSSGGVALWDPDRGELLGELAGSRRQPARALASIRVGRQVLVAAGGQDGVVRLWDPLSREGVGELRGHQGTVRALAGAELTGQPVLASASDDGEVRLWDLSTRSYISTVSSGARPSTHIVSDRPSTTDTLGRRAMVDALQDFLTDPSTAPPIVVGVHGPWGYGKTSVLTQLRARLDPDQPDVGWTEPGRPTYELVWDDAKDRGRLSAWGAWRRFERRQAAMTDGLGCRLKELGLDGPRERTRISVWFSPWMYPTREELWAGLARELLTSITHRLPREDREKLWFDLNLRRTDPQVMRRRILKSFVPRSPAGIMLAVLSFAVIVAALGAETYLLWSQHLKPLLAGLLVGFPLVGLLAKVVWTALRGTVKHVLPPEVLSGPTGASSNGRKRSPDTRDALYESEAGYLYLIQHDVRHIVRLATAEEPIVVFIDDLDRCSSEIVSSTMEAINLFMNNAFGECIFVVALDPATIAAHLEVSHDAIRRRIEERPVTYAHLGDIGWRFMEKIVDLPIRLPRLPDKAVSAYAAALVTPTNPRRPNGAPATAAEPAVPPNGSPLSKAAAVPEPAGPPYPQISTPADRALSPADSDTAAAVTATAARPSPSPVEAVTPTTAAAVADTVERIETIREVSDALRDAMLELPRRNPREMKRFLNLWRFYLGVESRTDQLPTDVDGLVVHGRSVARLVQIMLRWPKYLDRLGELHAGRTVLADLLAAADDPEAWRVALHQAGMESAEAELASLRELLAGGDPELAELSKRYL
ncbi:MAG TPA: P-loop NTPase fold protein [Pseudonocardiaceae bacterium]|nr:P-loop NTPase fold protein [Pseudonocardiaceae bacterium]